MFGRTKEEQQQLQKWRQPGEEEEGQQQPSAYISTSQQEGEEELMLIDDGDDGHSCTQGLQAHQDSMKKGRRSSSTAVKHCNIGRVKTEQEQLLSS